MLITIIAGQLHAINGMKKIFAVLHNSAAETEPRYGGLNTEL